MKSSQNGKSNHSAVLRLKLTYVRSYSSIEPYQTTLFINSINKSNDSDSAYAESAYVILPKCM